MQQQFNLLLQGIFVWLYISQKNTLSNGIEKYPKLRFPEFTAPWRDIKLSDVSSYRIKRTTVSKVKYVSTENMLQNYAGLEPYTEDTETDGIAISSDDTLLANIRPYLKKVWKSEFNGACSTDVLAFSPEQINPDFLYSLIARDKFIDYVMSGVKGSKMPRGDKNHIMDYATSIPIEGEQQKISSFVKLINKRITAQTHYIELLKKYKRGVETILFEGEYFIKGNAIRTCLGDVCSFFSGGTPSSGNSSYYGGNIPFIRSGEIHSEHTELQLTELGLKNSAAKMVARGDLLLALYGATSGEVDISKINGAINQAILCIRPDAINKIYLKHLLSHNKTNIINTYLQGGQGNLSAEIIKGLYFDIPDSHIQNEVSTLLDTLDKRINYAESQKSTLDLLKKGLLQQLFI